MSDKGIHHLLTEVLSFFGIQMNNLKLEITKTYPIDKDWKFHSAKMDYFFFIMISLFDP